MCFGERPVVDDRAHEVGQVGDVAHRERVGLGGELVAQPRPDAARHVGARGGRALLPLVLERAADEGRPQHVEVGARVGDDEVLAAGLADDARVGAVAVDVLADLAPELVEHRGRAGEVDAGEVGVGERDLGDRRCRAPVTMLMTPGGRPASSSSIMSRWAANCWVGAGFQTTMLPISAGAVGRLPAIAVKLNGVIA